MKIVILGSRGMLGRYLFSHLSKKHVVMAFDRADVDAAVVARSLRPHVPIFSHSPDLVINCMGTIKPRMSAVGIQDAIVVNSLFPHVLADECNRRGAKMIHVTTDCVYSGLRGNYCESDPHDALDDYGKSKSLGEPTNCTVIRTSIVGEEIGQGRSLLSWVLSQKDKEVNGFSNHLWNGITCLQFAEVVEKIIEKNLFWKGVRHIYSPHDHSKFGMLNIFNEIYQLNMIVNPKESEAVNRTLRTNFPELLGALEIPGFVTQVAAMKEWSIDNLR